MAEPVPFPSVDDVDLSPPARDESVRHAAPILSATRTESGNTEFQRLLIEATIEALTGHRIDAASLPFVDAAQNAANMGRRAQPFRMRIVHMMALSALVLKPIPPMVAAQVAEYSRLLGIDDTLLRTLQEFASSDTAVAAVDFERNGYTADWSPERSGALHVEPGLASGWDLVGDDPALAARWCSLGDLAPGTLGRGVFDF